MYPLSTYTFGQKAAVVEKHGSVPVRMERLKEKYESCQMFLSLAMSCPM